MSKNRKTYRAISYRNGEINDIIEHDHSKRAAKKFIRRFTNFNPESDVIEISKHPRERRSA